MNQTIVNKVSKSSLQTLDLAEVVPQLEDIVSLDITPFLYKGLIVKEKDFRESIDQLITTPFVDRLVCILTPKDVIIPMWAYMLIAKHITPVAKNLFLGGSAEAVKYFTIQAIEAIDISAYENQRVVVKGCGDKIISDVAYLTITKRLLPFAKSIMYGEPCSTVPIFKRK